MPANQVSIPSSRLRLFTFHKFLMNLGGILRCIEPDIPKEISIALDTAWYDFPFLSCGAGLEL